MGGWTEEHTTVSAMYSAGGQPSYLDRSQHMPPSAQLTPRSTKRNQKPLSWTPNTSAPSTPE